MYVTAAATAHVTATDAEDRPPDWRYKRQSGEEPV